MIIETKFSIGDKVYTVDIKNDPEYVACNDCNGKGYLLTKTSRKLSCVYCGSSGKKVEQWFAKAFVSDDTYTIGSVRFNSHDTDPVTYMCVETGVGSGSEWNEKDLFKTKKAAQDRCNALNKGKTNERDDN